MTEAMHNSVILKPANEERFNSIYAKFAKVEPNAMRFSEFMQFLLDRCLLTNKITLKNFYHLFVEATEKRIVKDPPPHNNIVLEKIIKKEQLIFLFNQLGKLLYRGAKGQQDKLYNDLLGEKTIADQQSMQYSRIMKSDETNRKMFLENSVKVLSQYEDQLKNIYLIYVDQNYWTMKKQGRLLLNHREVDLQNKKMSAVSFVRFLKQAEILPHLINIQQVQEILSYVIPSTNQKEIEFYIKHFLVDIYSKELDNPQIKHPGDPGLQLFEFICSIARIAIQTSKEVQNNKKVYDYIINKFLKGYLNIRTNDQMNDGTPMVNNNRIFLNKLRDYYRITCQSIDKDAVDEDDEEKNPFEIMKEKQFQMDNFPPLEVDIPAILKTLQVELPPMPEQINIDQEAPPPYPKKFKDVDKVIIGQQPPPEKQDKNKQMKPPAKKKPNLKKGEKPPRVFQYKNEQEQTKPILRSQDYFQKLASDLDYSLKPLSAIERGDIPIDPFPCLIAEILYPNQIPEEVLPYIQAGLNAHNDGLYALSLDNYHQAHEIWKDLESKPELTPNLELFFEFTIGSVYQSAGKDDYAFYTFYSCRSWAEKLPYLNPDRALPYAGMGQVLYNVEEYELASRCFLRAREIREKLLGVENVDTATVFNNLGCCFFMQDRNKEALSYFKVSQTVLRSQLGQFHERTQTAMENISLCNRSFYKNTPEYRKLWQVYEKDPFAKKKKTKKKKK